MTTAISAMMTGAIVRFSQNFFCLAVDIPVELVVILLKDLFMRAIAIGLIVRESAHTNMFIPYDYRALGSFLY